MSSAKSRPFCPGKDELTIENQSNNDNDNERHFIAKIVQGKSTSHAKTQVNLNENNWWEVQWDHNFDKGGRSNELCAPRSWKRHVHMILSEQGKRAKCKVDYKSENWSLW